MSTAFTKLHGLCNDFVLIDERAIPPGIEGDAFSNERIQKICNRHFGVGCDQLVLLKKSTDPAVIAKVIFFNTDGSRAQMCGNGIRAVALYVGKYGISGSLDTPVSERAMSQGRFETDAGVIEVEDQGGGQFCVEMPVPHFGLENEVVLNPPFGFTRVNVGNPHAVILVDELESIISRIPDIGPCIERDPLFPERTNVEFVQVLSRNEIRVIVWERGAGLTLACGTGAVASATAMIRRGVVDSLVKVHLPGGTLSVEWNSSLPHINPRLIGPAVEVFKGHLCF